MAKVARIKPFNPKKGLVTRTYTVEGYVYRVDEGWYEIDEPTAAYLSRVRTNRGNDESPFVFDVMTKEEADALEEREEKARRVAATAKDPVRVHRVMAASLDRGVGGRIPRADARHDPRNESVASTLTTRDLPSVGGTDNAPDIGDEDPNDAPESGELEGSEEAFDKAFDGADDLAKTDTKAFDEPMPGAPPTAPKTITNRAARRIARQERNNK